MSEDVKIMQMIREAATEHQVGSDKTAYAMAQMIAIAAEVDTSAAYAVVMEIAEKATEEGMAANQMAWDPTPMVYRMRKLNHVTAA